MYYLVHPALPGASQVGMKALIGSLIKISNEAAALYVLYNIPKNAYFGLYFLKKKN